MCAVPAPVTSGSFSAGLPYVPCQQRFSAFNICTEARNPTGAASSPLTAIPPLNFCLLNHSMRCKRLCTSQILCSRTPPMLTALRYQPLLKGKVLLQTVKSGNATPIQPILTYCSETLAGQTMAKKKKRGFEKPMSHLYGNLRPGGISQWVWLLLPQARDGPSDRWSFPILYLHLSRGKSIASTGVCFAPWLARLGPGYTAHVH